MTTEAELSRIIARHRPGVTLRNAIALRGGVSATVARVDIEQADGSNEQLVLREHGPSHCGHPADIEFALLGALWRTALPVPEPVAFGKGDGDDDCGRPYLLSRYIEGSTAIPADKVDLCIETAARWLRTIHAASVADLPSLPSRIDPVPELIAFLGSDDRWRALRTWLIGLKTSPFTGEPVLLHGDYWPGNWIWSDDRLAAIIDWEDAAIGDPLSDLACACLELRYLHGQRGADRFRDTYAERKTIDPRRFALWQAYVAAAGAQSMAAWGLPGEQEAHMRRTAEASIAEAAELLMSG